MTRNWVVVPGLARKPPVPAADPAGRVSDSNYFPLHCLNGTESFPVGQQIDGLAKRSCKARVVFLCLSEEGVQACDKGTP